MANDAFAASRLDSRFTDADGDLVADAPVDPKKWVNPSTLIFSYTPVEDPAVYKEVWKEFLDYLSKVTGKRVAFFRCSRMRPSMKRCGQVVCI